MNEKNSLIKKYIINLFVLVVVAFSSATYCAIFKVGVNEEYTELDQIPWLSLTAGDEVQIYWRFEPYRTKIGLRARGTAQQPVKLVGISNADGLKPVISGINATTPASLQGFFSEQWDESNGVILIKRAASDPWGYKPGHIVIENLVIEGGSPLYQFQNQNGSLRTYSGSASGVWATLVEHLVLTKNEFRDNGNGIFVLSKNSEAELSRDVTISHNTFTDNGVTNSFRQHHIYTQVANLTVEHNDLKPLRSGAQGSAIKDRGANTVIRYNNIEAGAYGIDLVDPEDSYLLMTQQAGFNETWVYGNIIKSIARNDRPYSSRLIHYGGDTGVYSIYRKGTLFFTHNTVFLNINRSQRWNSSIFVMDTNEESVDMCNNIIHSAGDTYLHLANRFGNLNIRCQNWLTLGVLNAYPDFAGAITFERDMLYGTSPGFRNTAVADFYLSADSAALNSAIPPATYIYTNHPVNQQFTPNLVGEMRPLIGANADLGAYETDIPDSPEPSELPVPYGLLATSVTHNAASLIWMNSDSSTQVVGYQILLNGSVVGFTTDNFYTINHLTAETSYQIAVVAVGISGETSEPSDSITIITENENSEPSQPGQWGMFNPSIGAIDQVYPAPNTAIQLGDKIKIKLVAPAQFEWTSGRYLKVFSANGTELLSKDIEPSEGYDGNITLEFTMAELNIHSSGDYSIGMDPTFVRVNMLPWRNAEVIPSLWQFTVVSNN